jgi:hypothetical protein
MAAKREYAKAPNATEIRIMQANPLAIRLPMVQLIIGKLSEDNHERFIKKL